MEIELKRIVGAYSRSFQGLAETKIETTSIRRVEKVNLHPQGICPIGIAVSHGRHGYTDYFLWDLDLFLHLKEAEIENRHAEEVAAG